MGIVTDPAEYERRGRILITIYSIIGLSVLGYFGFKVKKNFARWASSSKAVWAHLSKTERGAVSLSCLLLVVSLTQPALVTSAASDPVIPSILCLLLGWMAAFASGWGYIQALIWAANPLYFVALGRTLKKQSNSLVPSTVSFVLAISFLLLDEIAVGDHGTVRIRVIEAGYFLWLAAIAALFLLNVYRLKTKTSRL